jgi:antitoxin HicB
MNRQTSLEDLKTASYPVKLYFDERDSVYIAEFLDLPGCSGQGGTVQEAYKRAQEAKEEWIEASLENHLPIPKPSQPQEHSGRILLRLPSSLHTMLADRAQIDGVSLNQYIVHLLSGSLVADEVSTQFEDLKGCLTRVEQQLSALKDLVGERESALSQHQAGSKKNRSRVGRIFIE